jgi:plasmid stabilization system protein ParE
MKLGFLPEARMDERQAALWYRSQDPNLALRFRAELKATVQRVANAPLQFPLIGTLEHRSLLAVFPCSVIFEEIEDTIVVKAIVHNSRDPKHWQSRSL